MSILIILTPLLLAAFSFHLFAATMNQLFVGWRKAQGLLHPALRVSILASVLSFGVRQSQMEAMASLLVAPANSRAAWLRLALAGLPNLLVFGAFALIMQINGVFVLGFGLACVLFLPRGRVAGLLVWLGLSSWAALQANGLGRLWLAPDLADSSPVIFWLMDGRWPAVAIAVILCSLLFSLLRWQWLFIVAAPLLMGFKLMHPHLAYAVMLGGVLAPYLRCLWFSREILAKFRRDFWGLAAVQFLVVPLHLWLFSNCKEFLAAAGEFGEMLPFWWVTAVVLAMGLSVLVALLWGHFVFGKWGDRPAGFVGLHRVLESGDLSLELLQELKEWLDRQDQNSAQLTQRYSPEDLALLPESLRQTHAAARAEAKRCYLQLQKILLNHDLNSMHF